MAVVPLLLLLLSSRIQAAAQMTLLPETLSVLRGEEARFTCSPSSSEWTVMVWLLNGTATLTISNMHGVLPATNPNVTAERGPASQGGGWVFVLRSTQWHNQGQVTCDLQGIERKTAALFVQEKGSVEISGGDKVAFKGQSVEFECEATGWFPEPTLQWQVNDKEVSGGHYNASSAASRPSFFTVTSGLSVTAARSALVGCLASVSALPSPLRSSVRLTVVAEVMEEEDACTVPLVVTSSLAALLLLLLLCIVTVLCYRRRREAKAGPREAARVGQPVSGRIPVAETTRGKVNLGFSGENHTDAVSSELSRGSRSQMDSVSFHQVPDVACSRGQSVVGESQARVCLAEETPKTTRRITTV
ncbi:immunoglobulin superfamily member 5 isoform X2 [Betta splendens]|uniref:immunoglobulin superfamily member 5 isoform X2 n=1 Tax=Betta splendens TaxID=158456 RepID=UPI0010F57CEB|nr:immunoglobulin superfamily member 5 isoform X2 [Betta splendens]